MKCQTGGGSIIEELGAYPEEARLKCMACGREPAERREKEKRNMEKEMKKCKKCGHEKPATNEPFSVNKAAKDGLEYRCKSCKPKAAKDFRRSRLAGAQPNPGRKTERKYIRRANPAPAPASLGNAHARPSIVQTASPDEIVKALRKGFATQDVAT